ncbi:hypothetical protein A5698_23560 [Mycobacterium sp. E136]|uniref:hypothetical protein n=1 Tax=Mycobacterium sp. E136 TaxID=1834125 RepID=UPI00080092B8|nr:hypothetical protein [Mycobacterium sp. E136]OBG89082.1 hypothetical protein A5698_23560 [Mycobacterium sp. E136]
MQSATTLADPTALTPAQWSGRFAAYLARGRGNDDPKVVACRAALTYWRTRRAIDVEADRIAPGCVRRWLRERTPPLPHSGAAFETRWT